jgi:hypothetical protein
VRSWVLVVVLGQGITVSLAVLCAWGLRKDGLILGGRTLGYVCMVLATVLFPLGFFSATTAPTKVPAPLRSFSESAPW